MKSAQELFSEARSKITQVTPQQVREQRERGDAVVVIDVRESNEWNLGHVPGAMHISRGVLEGNIEARVPRDANVVLYCASGNRSALSARSLEEMGYTRVASMSGGFKEWVAAGGDIED
jgi:rhodanese-related sulfurtransferase